LAGQKQNDAPCVLASTAGAKHLPPDIGRFKVTNYSNEDMSKKYGVTRNKMQGGSRYRKRLVNKAVAVDMWTCRLWVRSHLSLELSNSCRWWALAAASIAVWFLTIPIPCVHHGSNAWYMPSCAPLQQTSCLRQRSLTLTRGGRRPKGRGVKEAILNHQRTTRKKIKDEAHIATVTVQQLQSSAV